MGVAAPSNALSRKPRRRLPRLFIHEKRIPAKMQFTPQQLTGGPKFHHKCRIGNWCEDLELDEIKLKDYLKKKEMGGLLVNAKQQRLEESLKENPLTKSEDGFF